MKQVFCPFLDSFQTLLERNRFSQVAGCRCSCFWTPTVAHIKQSGASVGCFLCWNSEMEWGARTWMTGAISTVWLTWVSLSCNNNNTRPSWLHFATFCPSNLTSHISVLIAGESSILVVAPGESMRVYSLLQLPMVESGSLEAIQHNLTLNTLW